MNNTSVKEQTRFRSIDGLRGFAAMAVVLYHLGGNLKSDLEQILPDFINTVFAYGYLGVPIFFVISGFVISHGVGASKITPSYAGNFILRRSVRLDLTYWASILLAISLLVVKNKFLDSNEAPPGFFVILSNMFYLQELLEIKPAISVVYWTLCLEVQLYLFFIFSLWLAQKISLSNTLFPHLLITLPLGIYSICLDLEIFTISIQGLFISSWHYFLMGVLINHVVKGVRHSELILALWLLVEIGFQTNLYVKAYTVAGIGSTLAIYLMWKLKKLDSFLTGRLFKYLGAISYTL
jgi:peptidoglycan/LPS O-acetylase OafA/YrhL